MAAIVDGIYYGCKTKYVEKCVKHGIKIIAFTKVVSQIMWNCSPNKSIGKCLKK